MRMEQKKRVKEILDEYELAMYRERERLERARSEKRIFEV
jgi:hypothetical protein